VNRGNNAELILCGNAVETVCYCDNTASCNTSSDLSDATDAIFGNKMINESIFGSLKHVTIDPAYDPTAAYVDLSACC